MALSMALSAAGPVRRRWSVELDRLEVGSQRACRPLEPPVLGPQRCHRQPGRVGPLPDCPRLHHPRRTAPQ